MQDQRLRAKAAVVHAEGADEQRGVLCAPLALQPPASFGAVIEVNEEVQAENRPLTRPRAQVMSHLQTCLHAMAWSARGRSLQGRRVRSVRLLCP